MLAVGDMVSRDKAQCLIPAGAKIGYCSSSLDRMTITSSHLYIWVERSTVKENCLFQDDMATP